MKIRKGVLGAGLTAILCLTSCGVFEEPIHEHNYKQTVIPPTATEQGYTLYECSCGESYTGDFTDALESLAFVKIGGKEEYRVVGLGTVQSSKVTVPETYQGLPVTEIGNYAFSGCEGITEVVLSDSVAVLENGCFSGCSKLTSVVLGKGVSFIDWRAFKACGNLTEVVFKNPDGWKWYTSRTLGHSICEVSSEDLSDAEKAASLLTGDGVTVTWGRTN